MIYVFFFLCRNMEILGFSLTAMIYRRMVFVIFAIICDQKLAVYVLVQACSHYSLLINFTCHAEAVYTTFQLLKNVDVGPGSFKSKEQICSRVTSAPRKL